MANPVFDSRDNEISGFSAEDLAKAMASAVKIVQTNSSNKSNSGSSIDNDELKEISNTMNKIKTLLEKNPQFRMGGAGGKKDTQDIAKALNDVLEKRNPKSKEDKTRQLLDKTLYEATHGHSVRVQDTLLRRSVDKLTQTIGDMLNLTFNKKTPTITSNKTNVPGLARWDSEPASRPSSAKAEKEKLIKLSQLEELNLSDRAMARLLKNTKNYSNELGLDIHQWKVIGTRIKAARELIDDKGQALLDAEHLHTLEQSLMYADKLGYRYQERLKTALEILTTEGGITKDTIKQLNAITEEGAARAKSANQASRLEDHVSRMKAIGAAGARVASGIAGFGGLDQFQMPDTKLRPNYIKDTNAALYETMGVTKDATGATKQLQEAYLDLGRDEHKTFIRTGQDAATINRTLSKNMRRGIQDVTKVDKLTMTGLATAKIIGSDAEATADEFADWHQHLQLSSGEMSNIGRSLAHVGRMTGISGNNLLEIFKSTKGIAQQMKWTGQYTEEAQAFLMKWNAAAKTTGTEGLADKLQKGLASKSGFYNSDPHTMALLSGIARNGGVMPELQKGTMMKTVEGQKGFVRGGEELIKQFTGGKEFEDLDEDMQTMIAHRFEDAYHVEFGAFRAQLKQTKENLRTPDEKIADLNKEKNAPVVTDRRRMQIEGDIAKLNKEKQTLEYDQTQVKLQKAAKALSSGGGVKSADEAIGGDLKTTLNKQLDFASQGITDKEQLKQIEGLREDIKSGEPKRLLKAIEDINSLTESADVKAKVTNNIFSEAENRQHADEMALQKAVGDAQEALADKLGAKGLVLLNEAATATNVTLDLILKAVQVMAAVGGLKSMLGGGGAGGLGVGGLAGGLVAAGGVAAVAATSYYMQEAVDQSHKDAKANVAKREGKFTDSQYKESKVGAVIDAGKSLDEKIKIAQDAVDYTTKLYKGSKEQYDDLYWWQKGGAVARDATGTGGPFAQLKELGNEQAIAMGALEKLKKEKADQEAKLATAQKADPQTEDANKKLDSIDKAVERGESPHTFYVGDPETWRLMETVADNTNPERVTAATYDAQDQVMRNHQDNVVASTNTTMEQTTSLMDQIAANTMLASEYLKDIVNYMRDWDMEQSKTMIGGFPSTASDVKPRSPANYWSFATTVMSNPNAGSANPTPAL